MKRILTLLLTCAMILSLAACGNKDDDKTKGQPDTEKHEQDQTEVQAPETNGYDLTNPEEDRENAPGYLYYVQTVPTKETGLTSLLTSEYNDSYCDNIATEIQKIPLFSRCEVIQEPISTGVELVDENGNPVEDTAANDVIVYVQDEAYVNEISVAVYQGAGYSYLTYGKMEYVEDPETWSDELDISDIPELTETITGMTITEDDIAEMIKQLVDLRKELPDEAIYMASITDPETYSTIQVAILPYEGPDLIGFTASRYIERADAMPLLIEQEPQTDETPATEAGVD